MKKVFMRKSKKGITLVESIIAVVVLGLFATGILSLLSSSGSKIFRIRNESTAYAQATQQLDLVISAISNGSDSFLEKQYETPAEGAGGNAAGDAAGETEEESTPAVATKCRLKLSDLPLEEGASISAKVALYDRTTLEDCNGVTYHDIANVRGWYITLTYKGASVSGFASNTEGVFDS